MNHETKNGKAVPHHWIIESAYSPTARSFVPTSEGVCRYCGETKRFPNGFDAPYEPRRDPNDIQHGNRLLAKREFSDSQLLK